MAVAVIKEIDQAPDWNEVRPIYKKLSEEFHVLTDAYGLDISESRKLKLDYLIVVIDEVDSVVDDLPLRSQRDELTVFLIDFLKNKSTPWDTKRDIDSLGAKMKRLKEVVHKENIVEDFVGAAETIFHYTEIKRHTKDPKKLIEYICLEGKATALMPLSILEVSPDHNFAIFFTKLCTLMGIADLVVDARSDYKSEYIVIKPSWGLYLRLNKIMIVEGVKLLWNFPKKIPFILYCIRFSWALFR